MNEAASSLPVSGKRVLVTGGAGFLGINLCRLLLERGYVVRSMDIAPFDYPESDSIDVLQKDIRDYAAVESAMSDVDTVVHCAAALPLSTKEDIQSTDVEGTRILLDAAARHSIERFVFISSTSVYGIPDHHPVLESDALQGVGPYGQAKIDAEGVCREARARGLCVPIFRPKSFVGPERLGVFELLYDWAYSGRNFPILGSGENPYQLLDVADLCEAIVLGLTLEEQDVNDTFNVGAVQFGTMRDNIQSVLDRAGHGKHVVSLPKTPAIAVLRILEAMRLSPLYSWIYETAACTSIVSVERAKTRLGFSPRFSNRMALVRNYDWYLAHRAEYLHKAGITHRLPWKKGALNVAKLFF